jgi:relaxase-like protein
MIVFKGGRRSASGARTGLLKSFGGLIAYLTEGSRDALNPDRVAWTSCRNLDGVNDPARVAQVMRAHASQNPRAENPVYHFGLSLHPAEHLSPEQWDQAVDRVLQRLGLGRHQALIVAHRDTDHEHVHVIVNRVGDDDRTWRKDMDLVKSNGAIRRIEVEYGLTCNGNSDLPAPVLSSGAYRQAPPISRPLPTAACAPAPWAPSSPRNRAASKSASTTAARWPSIRSGTDR